MMRLLGSTRWATASSTKCLLRSFSSSSELVETQMDSATGVATLTMQNPPVNSLSMEMCQALSSAIKSIEADPAARAMILTSNNPKIFSAGLDLMEMHQPDKTRLSQFWLSFQQLYLDLYGSRLGTVACMQGTAPAAGCMLALSCDYRILSSNPSSRIGLNETKLGIVAPPWLGRQFMDTIGRRQAELGLALGTLYEPEQALALGLVDQVVDHDQVMEHSLQMALEFCKIPPHALQASKKQMRGKALRQLTLERRQDKDFFVDFILQDRVQKAFSAYLEALNKKKSK